MTNREMKSKVMTLGNRIAAKTGDRKAAFVQAWEIVKAGSVEVKAAGVSFGLRPVALARLTQYAPEKVHAFIVPDTLNPAGANALQIMVGVQGGRGLFVIGYVSRKDIPLVSALHSLPSVRVVGDEIKGLRLRFTV